MFFLQKLHCSLIIFLYYVGDGKKFVNSCRGCAHLDEFIFDKILSRFPVTIVKFDIAFPYGEQHESFSDFAINVGNSSEELLVGHVGIKDYGERDNVHLGKRFNVEQEHLPIIKLFKNSDINVWTDFPKDKPVTVDTLKKFVLENSNLHIGQAGTIKSFDILASKVMRDLSSDKNHESVVNYINDAKLLMGSLVTSDDQISGNFYYNLIKNTIAEGVEYPFREKLRVTKLLETKLTKKKAAELLVKLNICQTFIDYNKIISHGDHPGRISTRNEL